MTTDTTIRRAQLTDVAAAAGVSLATVDRVLHGRAGVRPGTVEQVQAAIQRLEYRADPAATRLARGRASHSVAVVLPSGNNSFVSMLVDQVQSLGPWLTEQRLATSIHRVDVFSPDAVARGQRWEAFYSEAGGLADMIAAIRKEAFEAAAELDPRETALIYYWSTADRNLRKLDRRVRTIVENGKIEARRGEHVGAGMPRKSF